MPATSASSAPAPAPAPAVAPASAIPVEVPGDFMTAVHHSIVKVRGVTDTTASAYMRVLFALNGRAPFKSLGFLHKTAEIDRRLSEYAVSTRRSMLAAVVSVLTMAGRGHGVALRHYTKEMNDLVAEAAAAPHGIKTEKQSAAWLTWDEVLARKKALDDLSRPVLRKKAGAVTPVEHGHLLDALVLGLYTEIPPRRNLDFMAMRVVKKYTPDMDAACNYLDLTKRQFVFNRFKTAKSHGTQVEAIPAPLWATLRGYLAHFPKGSPINEPLLVTATGEAITANNAITRILNRVLGKKAGASMLRHIFITSKYGDTLKEMADTASAMGHTTSMQRDYVLRDPPSGAGAAASAADSESEGEDEA